MDTFTKALAACRSCRSARRRSPVQPKDGARSDCISREVIGEWVTSILRLSPCSVLQSQSHAHSAWHFARLGNNKICCSLGPRRPVGPESGKELWEQVRERCLTPNAETVFLCQVRRSQTSAEPGPGCAVPQGTSGGPSPVPGSGSS